MARNNSKYIKIFSDRKNKRKKKAKAAVSFAVMLVIFMFLVIPYISGRFKEPAPENADSANSAASESSDRAVTAMAVKISDVHGVSETVPEEPPSLPGRVKVKGLYLTGWTAGDSAKLESFIEICGRTEINALIIDVKDDSGAITFDSSAGKGSAADVSMIKDMRSVVSRLKSAGIYAVARIVCFKDPSAGEENPAIAIKSKNGSLWKDGDGNAWLDPFNPDAWEYIVNVAREAAGFGFDEIQFDYVRFPADGKISEMDFADNDISENSRAEAVSGFLSYAKDKLRNDGVYISADVFGITLLNKGDAENIGQDFELITQNSDYICPMIYPSHYANKKQNGAGQEIRGILFEAPDLKPYEVVYNTLVSAKERLSESGGETKVRPYLQDFTASYLGEGFYMEYAAAQVEEQIKAVYDAGFEEWILWNASNKYSFISR